MRLSNPAAAVLDSVSFGPQIVNRTWARIPDATGAFAAGAHPADIISATVTAKPGSAP